jgi:hypothetical protein
MDVTISVDEGDRTGVIHQSSDAVRGTEGFRFTHARKASVTQDRALRGTINTSPVELPIGLFFRLTAFCSSSTVDFILITVLRFIHGVETATEQRQTYSIEMAECARLVNWLAALQVPSE